MFARIKLLNTMSNSMTGFRKSRRLFIPIAVFSIVIGMSCLAGNEDQYQNNQNELLENIDSLVNDKSIVDKLIRKKQKVEENPENSIAWRELGKAVIDASNWGENADILSIAEKPLRKAVELDSQSSQNYYWLGKYWMYVGIELRSDLEQSLRAFQRGKKYFLRSENLNSQNSRTTKQIKLINSYIERRKGLMRSLDKDGILRMKLLEAIKDKKSSNQDENMKDKSSTTKTDEELLSMPSCTNHLKRLRKEIEGTPNDLDKRLEYIEALYKSAIRVSPIF